MPEIPSFAIDVSGTPMDTVYLGLVGISPSRTNAFETNFRYKFPDFFRAKAKGSKLDENQLVDIVDFMSRQGVLMSAIEFSVSDWSFYRDRFVGRANLKEKIFAVLYFNLLQSHSIIHKTHQVTVCKESFMDIDKVLGNCRRLAGYNRCYYDFSVGYAKYNKMLKFADYVASALRKADPNKLRVMKNFKVLKGVVDDNHFRVVFRENEKR